MKFIKILLKKDGHIVIIKGRNEKELNDFIKQEKRAGDELYERVRRKA